MDDTPFNLTSECHPIFSNPWYHKLVVRTVVRIDPSGKPRLVFDTLVNPRRPMASTEIHGITNKDVQNAPCFHDIAGELIQTK
jgi:DNA polymerase III epsilon subunit-like protein